MAHHGGGKGGAQDKIEAMRSAGSVVAESPAAIGTTVQDVNRVMKQFQEMSRMIKRVNKMGQKGLMRGGVMPPGMMPPR